MAAKKRRRTYLCPLKQTYTVKKERPGLHSPIYGWTEEMRARVAKGGCPFHGVGLVPFDMKMEGVARFQCPRKDCGAVIEAGVRSDLFLTL